MCIRLLAGLRNNAITVGDGDGGKQESDMDACLCDQCFFVVSTGVDKSFQQVYRRNANNRCRQFDL